MCVKQFQVGSCMNELFGGYAKDSAHSASPFPSPWMPEFVHLGACKEVSFKSVDHLY